jgi:hypothetical protein
LANSYIQYIATRPEYQFQAYEGASTLYGPASAEFFSQVLEELALDLVGSTERDSQLMGQSIAREYKFAPRQDRLPIRTEVTKDARFKSLSLCTILELNPVALCFRWTHGEPGQVPLTTAPWIELTPADGQAPPDACDSRERIDDSGVDFQTRVRERTQHEVVWSTLFRPSRDEWKALNAAGMRYRLQARGDEFVPAVASPSFSFQSLPEPCTPAQVMYCVGMEKEWQQ